LSWIETSPSGALAVVIPTEVSMFPHTGFCFKLVCVCFLPDIFSSLHANQRDYLFLYFIIRHSRYS
jgi:hypothetical protein